MIWVCIYTKVECDIQTMKILKNLIFKSNENITVWWVVNLSKSQSSAQSVSDARQRVVAQTH